VAILFVGGGLLLYVAARAARNFTPATG
jgi:hypothetical protein